MDFLHAYYLTAARPSQTTAVGQEAKRRAAVRGGLIKAIFMVIPTLPR
jgi:hypothetical protein